MGYEYELFLSYRRSSTVGAWVKNHFYPRLTARLDEIAPGQVRVSCDLEMNSGVAWPAELKRRLGCSGLLLAVWSADYFRSSWCMAEWRSFKEREKMLGLFSARKPTGLVYPVRYADGEYYHPDAQLTQCRKDFSRLNYPDEAFRSSARYMDFDDQIQEMAAELVDALRSVPAWQKDFPIQEPAPLPPAPFNRPLL